MNIDVEGFLDAVERSVSSTERDGQLARVGTLARDFATGIEDVWDAVANGERIPRWFLPISGELIPGGRFQLEGNASGKILECERPSYFAVTWEFAGDVSWVEVRLAGEEVDRVRLTMTHTSLLSEHWDTYGPGATGVGWELGLMGLAIHLANPEAPMPEEDDFATSTDGKAFIVGSSERWGHAAVGAGSDPEIANTAARRTTAFYTGETAESG